jgi:hypothetical protein
MKETLKKSDFDETEDDLQAEIERLNKKKAFKEILKKMSSALTKSKVANNTFKD